MRSALRSPLSARIAAVTNQVEEALNHLPTLPKKTSQKSDAKLRVPKYPDKFKSTTLDGATQDTRQKRLKTEPVLKLRFGDLKSHTDLEHKTAEDTSNKK